jgi:hypothetical protein
MRQNRGPGRRKIEAKRRTTARRSPARRAVSRRDNEHAKRGQAAQRALQKALADAGDPAAVARALKVQRATKRVKTTSPLNFTRAVRGR